MKHENKIVKVYIVIYNFAVSRAIHLDVVSDVTAEAILESFRRFTALLGIPQEGKTRKKYRFRK